MIYLESTVYRVEYQDLRFFLLFAADKQWNKNMYRWYKTRVGPV